MTNIHSHDSHGEIEKGLQGNSLFYHCNNSVKLKFLKQKTYGKKCLGLGK